MNNLVVLCGAVMLGITSTPQEESIPNNYENEVEITNVILAEENLSATLTDADDSVWQAPKLVSRTKMTVSSELDLSEIDFIEEKLDFDLGFDTKAYLPEDFDPYTAYFDLASVVFLEEDSVDLGFDNSKYLPDGFDAYAFPNDISGINFIEEEDLDLGFNTESYLPKHFNPYEFYFDLDSVEYIEELDLDMNAEYCLPSVNSEPSSK